MALFFRQIIYYSLLANFLQAQTWKDITTDYIINPSFETYNSCPEDGSGYPTPLWLESAEGWYFPTQGTSDYFNSCNTLPNSVGVPANALMQYQYAYNGNGYCGFFAYEVFSGGIYSEYIQSKLIKPLTPKKKYMFSMRVNRANDFNVSVKNIGAHFHSNQIIDYSTYSPLEINPTILNSTGFLNDTLNWILFKGEFIASENESFLTIGWFGSESSDDLLKYFFIPPLIDSLTGDSLYVPSIYYAVDSLKLYELEYNIDNFNLNIITPNFDGLNDSFDFSQYDEINYLEFLVYNRWGNLVFSSKDTNLKWDGLSLNSTKLNTGVYYYILKVTTRDSLQIEKRHIVTINY